MAAAKKGLYANLNAKRERIAHGSGEKMRKPGDDGAPAKGAFEESEKTSKTAVAKKRSTAAKKSATKKAATKKAATKKTATKKTAMKGSAAKKAPAGKSATKKASTKRATKSASSR